MNVNIQTGAGLRVYRELIEKELSAPARWEQTYGVHNQLKAQDPNRLLLLNGLEAAVSLPMPMDIQLFHLQRERIRAVKAGKEWEVANLPKFSRQPISNISVDVFGEAKAREQRPNAEKRERPLSAPVTYSQGPPHSRGLPNQTTPYRLRNKWSIEHEYFKRERVGAVHYLNRKPVSAKAWA